jgi:hypothetical protein
LCDCSGGLQAFAWLGVGAAFNPTPGGLIARTMGSDLEVLGDVNGDAVADVALLLKATSTLCAGAFVL